MTQLLLSLGLIAYVLIFCVAAIAALRSTMRDEGRWQRTYSVPVCLGDEDGEAAGV